MVLVASNGSNSSFWACPKLGYLDERHIKRKVMIKQYNIYFDRETSFFSSKQCFDKSWGLWQIILRLRFLCGLSHMHGLNPYTFFSRASAATQPFENSVFQHTGYVPTRITSMPWRKQFPTTRAKLHFTKQWGYAVGCCWFWTHRRHHLRGFGAALRNRLQPGAQFVSLSTLSCEFFDCEILRTSQKIQVSIF